ncbi:exodeoxyribonuclease V subunit alpha [Vibrio sp. 10N.286.49.B3]|uniref:exodeoxyribonuclease V subunit alpha n=1 Tax=Vibrio sp. 10N.286.49.B3 TaxID=1880855 RepID=UPI000C850A83|nr:exodeoxyribonuclease V subunit alpha [Vibrio sp. 10N.286.49.B3]PMH41159.1 exodeoxyribonuclease V subunit alpha [Vibrio sp. 10N.286.49.B3]
MMAEKITEQKSLMAQLELLSKKGAIRQLDYQFARFNASQALAYSDEIGFLAGVLSHELGKGNICINFTSMPDLVARLGVFGEAAVTLNQQVMAVNWQSIIAQSNLIGSQGEAVPMMFDSQRLYLHRYWHYEVNLADKLKRLSQPVILDRKQTQVLSNALAHLFKRQYSFLFKALIADKESAAWTAEYRQQLVCDHLDIVNRQAIDWSTVDQLLIKVRKVTDLNELDELIPLSACLNWQKVAAAVALTRRFAVISGGPGTGKTTTVTKLLSALVEQAQDSGETPTIKLVAPTGKAAARLTESIGGAIDELALSPEVKALIPTESSTLHRLLGAIPQRAEFRHHSGNRLHVDILVVDEASMVDLPMMFKLVDALPDHARLILLGDKDQLASVEAGAVLGDICSFNQFGFSHEQASQLATMTQFDHLMQLGALSSSREVMMMADSLCVLQKSYRFDARSGIGQLAKAINSGNTNVVERVLAQPFSDIERLDVSSDSYNRILHTLVEQYGYYLKRIKTDGLSAATGESETQEEKVKAVLSAFSQCRLLCGIREGDFGVAGLNMRVERALTAKGFISAINDELWYSGRPVMVTQNDHALGLYNGDIGICMRDPESDKLKVYFELPDGSVKAVLPSRVPEHETAYAMTIHKSQGSEFNFTIMVLPPEFSPILSRELIYTGITRAKKTLMLLCDLGVLKRGVKVKTQRESGLIERLS